MGRPRSIAHVPAMLARVLRFVGPKVPRALIDAMLNDSRTRPDSALGVRIFANVFGSCMVAGQPIMGMQLTALRAAADAVR